MLTHWKTCLSLILEDLQLRLERAVDGARLALCQVTVHRFPPDTDRCTRCDAVRVEFWGHKVVLDG